MLAAAALAAASAQAIGQTTSDKVERKVDRAAETTKDTAQDAKDKLERKTDRAVDKTQSTAEDTKNKAEHKADHASDKAKGMASDAKAAVSDSWLTSKTKIALFADERVKGRQVNVETMNGTVLLRGKVDSDAAKTAAESVAKGVDGVRAVKNELQVVAPGDQKAVEAKDEEITKAVKDRLSRDSQLKKIDVKTDAGVVSLTGDADRIGVSARASEIARGVPGVRAVKNDLTYKDEARAVARDSGRSDRYARTSADHGSARHAAAVNGGEDVRMVQQALKQQGYDPGPIDGVIGPQTTTALRSYQKAEGMQVTGRADTETLGKLGVGAPAASAGSESSKNKKQSP